MILEYLLIFDLKNSNLFKKNLTNPILGRNTMSCIIYDFINNYLELRPKLPFSQKYTLFFILNLSILLFFLKVYLKMTLFYSNPFIFTKNGF